MARLFTLDTVQVTSISTFPITTYPFTMCGWIKNSSGTAGANNTLLGFADNSSTDQRCHIRSSSSGANMTVHALVESAAAGTASGTTLITAGEWGHVVGVFRTSTDREVYLNGVSDGTNTSAVTFPTGLDAFALGRFPDSTPSSIADNVDIAECAIWDVELTAGEITSLAKGTSPNQIRTTNLKGYWPVHGDSSNEPDLSGGGNNMTVTGTVKVNHAPVGRLVREPVGDVSGRKFNACLIDFVVTEEF